METDKKREDELISRTDLRLLARAKECWDFLKDFRRERERCKNFTYGDQWNDFIEDRGVRMRECDYIVSQGNMPLKNNLIRRLVRNVLGVYRNRWKMPRCERVGSGDGREIVAVNGMLEYISDINRLEEVYARTMEEFLITRVRDKNFMFFNQAKDIENWAAFQGRLIYLYSLVLIPEDKLPV